MHVDVVVTRHQALREYLAEIGVTSDCTVEHASADDIRGKVVAGVLPLPLAALCRKVVWVGLNIPPELRGKELSIEQMRELEPVVETYVVETVEDRKEREDWMQRYWEGRC